MNGAGTVEGPQMNALLTKLARAKMQQDHGRFMGVLRNAGSLGAINPRYLDAGLANALGLAHSFFSVAQQQYQNAVTHIDNDLYARTNFAAAMQASQMAADTAQSALGVSQPIIAVATPTTGAMQQEAIREMAMAKAWIDKLSAFIYQHRRTTAATLALAGAPAMNQGTVGAVKQQCPGTYTRPTSIPWTVSSTGNQLAKTLPAGTSVERYIGGAWWRFTATANNGMKTIHAETCNAASMKRAIGLAGVQQVLSTLGVGPRFGTIGGPVGGDNTSDNSGDTTVPAGSGGSGGDPGGGGLPGGPQATDGSGGTPGSGSAPPDYSGSSSDGSGGVVDPINVSQGGSGSGGSGGTSSSTSGAASTGTPKWVLPAVIGGALALGVGAALYVNRGGAHATPARKQLAR